MTTVPDPNGMPDIERPIDLTDTPERDRSDLPEDDPDGGTSEPSGRPAPDVTPMS